MHIPDGFIDAPVSIAFGAVSVAALAVAVRRSARELDERQAPLAGLVAAFVFAVQMLNFPVALGTSGHLLGGALAAILVGPATGALCLAVVLAVQALFADGGLTALGLNVFNMGIVTAVAGYLVFRGLAVVLPRTRGSLVAAAGIAAVVSVPLSALSFVAQFALGGTADLPIGGVAAAMGGVHVLIGIGEGIITALTVGAVLAARPDLVHGARGLLPRLELRSASGTATADPAAARS